MAKKAAKKKGFNAIATRQQDVGDVLGVSTRTFRNYLERGCPGKPGAYDLREIVPWVRENVDGKTSAPEPADDDPLLDGTVTPALEEYRRERALMARIDRLAKEGKLVPISQSLQAWGAAADVLRTAAETAGEEYGEECRLIFDEALDDIEALFEKEFPVGGDESQSSST